MKKLVSLCLSAGLILSCLAGCGGQTVDAPVSNQPSTDAANNQGIALVMAERDEFLSTLEQQVVAKAKERGYDVTAYAAGDGVKQYDNIKAAVTNGSKVIIVNLAQTSLADQMLEAAGEAQVVFINRIPNDTSLLDEKAAYVGSDEKVSGYEQGQALSAYFKGRNKTEIRYLLLGGIPKLGHTEDRTNGVLNALKENGIQASPAVDPLVCNFDRNTALESLTPILQEDIAFDCIISNNDAMALGAIEAMKQAGMDPKAIPIVGIDLIDDAKAAIDEGEMLMSVYQSAEDQAACAVAVAVNMLEGKGYQEGVSCAQDTQNPYIFWVPFQVADKSNLEQFT